MSRFMRTEVQVSIFALVGFCHVIAHGDVEVRLILSSRIWIDSIKPSNKWPLGRNVGHVGETRCSYLVTSGRRTSEGERERSQMIGWDPKNGSGTPFPSAEVNRKKFSFLSRVHSGQTNHSHFTPGWRQKINWDTKDSKSFKPVLKTEQSLVARERRKFSSGTPSKIR